MKQPIYLGRSGDGWCFLCFGFFVAFILDAKKISLSFGYAF